MGVLPLQFSEGDSAQSLGLTGRETFEVSGFDRPDSRHATVTVTPESGPPVSFEVRVRIDTPKEREYFRHGGILHYVLRQRAQQGRAA
jgi:aconitate hydratase